MAFICELLRHHCFDRATIQIYVSRQVSRSLRCASTLRPQGLPVSGLLGTLDQTTWKEKSLHVLQEKTPSIDLGQAQQLRGGYRCCFSPKFYAWLCMGNSIRQSDIFLRTKDRNSFSSSSKRTSQDPPHSFTIQCQVLVLGFISVSLRRQARYLARLRYAGFHMHCNAWLRRKHENLTHSDTLRISTLHYIAYVSFQLFNTNTSSPLS